MRKSIGTVLYFSKKKIVGNIAIGSIKRRNTMRAIDVDGAKRLAEECWPNPVHRLAIDGLLDMCPIIDPKSFQTHGQ